jgi:hypothetical protein
MRDSPTFVLLVILVGTAVVLLCAVWIDLRRPPQADPFFQPFGDMPGFTAKQLDAMSAGAMQNAARDPLRRSFAYPDPRCACGCEPSECVKRPNCAFRMRKSRWQRFKEWLASKLKSQSAGRLSARTDADGGSPVRALEAGSPSANFSLRGSDAAA